MRSGAQWVGCVAHVGIQIVSFDKSLSDISPLAVCVDE